MTQRLIFAGLLAAALAGCNKPSRVVEVEPVAAAQTPSPEAKPRTSAEGAESAETDAGAFNFPDDAAGRLLAKTLSQKEPGLPPIAPQTAPRPASSTAGLERPDLPLAQLAPSLPSLPLGKRPSLSPHGLAESAPLDYYRGDLVPPQRPELPPAALLRQRAPDVHEPVPLPNQARPAADRASLEDPTADFSSQRVVVEAIRLRTTPAPFQRYNLPEPFEHRTASALPATEPPIVAPVPTPPK